MNVLHDHIKHDTGDFMLSKFKLFICSYKLTFQTRLVALVKEYIQQTSNYNYYN